jgi:hypothetical protein
MDASRLDDRPTPHRASRRGVLTALAVGAALPVLHAPAVAAADATPIGVAKAGRSAFSLLGKIEQHGDDFTAYGYLTDVWGAEIATLFGTETATDWSEQTARLTFTATAKRIGHFIYAPVFVVHATGSFLIYAGDTSGAGFDKPDSFARGEPVAVGTLSLESVVTEQVTASGVVIATIEIEQTQAIPFTLGGKSYQIGKVDQVVRGSLAGKGTLVAASQSGQPELPHSEIIAAGTVTVVG